MTFGIFNSFTQPSFLIVSDMFFPYDIQSGRSQPAIGLRQTPKARVSQ